MRGRTSLPAVGLILLLGAALILAAPPGPGAQPRCAPTPRDAEGPFYTPNAPRREATGRGLAVSGVVRSAESCRPLSGARVEWWQAGPDGRYGDAHRGHQVTTDDGAYRFETDFPPPYFGRPSHIHFKALAPGHRALTTQLYPRAGQTDITFDLVLTKE